MRRVPLFVGACLLLFAIFLPSGWYDAFPPNPEFPVPPVSGLTLLRLSFGIEGLFLIWLSRGFGGWTPLRTGKLAGLPHHPADELVGRRQALAWLAGITLLGLALRLWRLDADLWLDEVAPLMAYGQMSPLQVMTSYLGSNNHLLNTLLVKLAVSCFGEHEWSVRLPAVVFGTATIPAFYWTGRMVLTRASSLAAALLLAVSYHHVFFSQNARGYTAYVLFSLVSSVLFCKAVENGRLRTWALYVAAMLLNMASLLIGAFVLASHMVVSLGILVTLRGARRSVTAGIATFVAVFGATALLIFQLYAMILPQAYVLLKSVYRETASGYSLASGDFVNELARGVLVAFGGVGGWKIVPVLILGLAVGGYSFVRLGRRHPPLLAALTLPGVLTAGAVVLGGLSVSPRFFLLSLPVAILVFVEALDTLAGRAWRWWSVPRGAPAPRWLVFALSVATSALLVVPLFGYYYVVPKQSYTASAAYVQRERQPGDLVVVVHLAEKGYLYYGPRFGLEPGPDCVHLRSAVALENVLRTSGHRRIVLVTTFHRALRLEYPDLDSLIRQKWMIVKVFPATIGDGEISVWTPK